VGREVGIADGTVGCTVGVVVGIAVPYNAIIADDPRDTLNTLNSSIEPLKYGSLYQLLMPRKLLDRVIGAG